jgi:hypothetical protein
VVAYEGKYKIAGRWEDHPYLILSQPNTGIPVFKDRREDGVGRCKTLHRNLLLPIGTKIPSSTLIPAPRRIKSRESGQDKQPFLPSLEDEADDESDFVVFPVGTGTKTQSD